MKLADIRREAFACLRPPVKLALSEWIEQTLVLPAGTSALTGKVRLWPPQKGIAAAISDSAIQRVTLVKAVRCGFTTLLTATLASYVVNEPSAHSRPAPDRRRCSRLHRLRRRARLRRHARAGGRAER